MKLRATIALAAAAVGALFFAPVAPAAAYPANVCPSLSVSTTHPLPGATLTVSGVNFDPRADVRLELHSQVYVLATAHTDASGSFSADVKLPGGVVGRHEIVATTGFTATQDCPGSPSVVITIQSLGTAGASSGPGGTSFTGVDVLLIVLAAGVLIVAGVALNQGGRRRRAHSVRA